MIGADALLHPAYSARIAARRVLLARDDAARAARIVRVSDDPATLAGLVAVVEAVQRLRASMDGGDGLPWWCRYEEDGIGFRCVGCGNSAQSSGIRRADDCPALALDIALAALPTNLTAALPPGSVIVPAEQWQTLFYACQALARVAGVDLSRPES